MIDLIPQNVFPGSRKWQLIGNIESMETITKKQLKAIRAYEYLTDFYTTYGIETYLHPDGKVTLDFEDDQISFVRMNYFSI